MRVVPTACPLSRDVQGAEVTLVVLDNGPAAADAGTLAHQLADVRACPSCPSFTVQVAMFGRDQQPASR